MSNEGNALSDQHRTTENPPPQTTGTHRMPMRVVQYHAAGRYSRGGIA